MRPQGLSDPARLLGLWTRGGTSPGSDPASSGKREASRPWILLVEDDVGIREAMQSLLEDDGYRVTTAGNGREALDLLRSDQLPDLIVLDLRMPVMDGWEFRAAQKNDPNLASIPIVAVSADDSAKAAAIDAESYLHKPLNADALLAAVARILGEEERRSLTRRLEEAERFAALGRLAATVGHEINNPLTFLAINVDLVTADLRQMSERSERGAFLERGVLDRFSDLLRDCRAGVDRIRNVVANLQSLSRPPEPKREPFSVNDVLDRAIAMARHKAEHRAAVVRVYGDLPPVIGDPSALGQVFLNLILNAADALPEGRAAENQIVVRSLAHEASAVIEVSDTGPGIPEDLLSRLFDPFFTTKPLGEGTGLGLSVSRRIVAEHGGSLEAANNLDRGATFRVVLPLGVARAPERPADETPQSAALGARGRVLVIDDEPIIGRTIEAALAGEHEVVAVSRASEAFARLAAGETFDVILCDVIMPEMSGREIHERLLNEWPRAARCLVFMTAAVFTAEMKDFVDRASRPVLLKPFRIDELRAVLREQIDGQAQRCLVR